jgi:aminoglycoside 6'-N-acetyltransferase
VIELRRASLADLALVAGWLREPHVARWYLAGSSADEQLRDCRASIDGSEPTQLLVAHDGGQAVGWCQWYRLADYPDWAADVGVAADDVGIDYAIGAPDRVGSGLGTDLIGALVRRVREQYPAAAIVAVPEAANVPSRRVLAKNGFALLGERPLASEPTPAPMAIYRLAAG